MSGLVPIDDESERAVLELHLTNVSDSDGGDYVCLGRNNITNLISSPEEATVTLTVLGKSHTSWCGAAVYNTPIYSS